MPSAKPNIVFLFPDQLRRDFLGCYGADFIETPHIDRIARRGIRYERSYSTSPICVPARAALITGMGPLQTGVADNGQWLREDIAEMGVQTWPEMLNGAGYYTAAIGKMHFYPWDILHGFQYRRAAEDKRWIHVRDDYWAHLKDHGYRKYHGNEHDGYHENKGAIINRIPWEHSVDHFTGEEAVKFINQYADDGPFAMMVGFPGPHCPYDPNEEFLSKVDPEKMPDPVPVGPDELPGHKRSNVAGNISDWNGVDYTEFTDSHKRKIRAHYAASVMQIDAEVGSIMEALEQQGVMDNTLIIFSSDHGDYLGDHDLIGKGTFFESSIAVPLLVKPPQATGESVEGGFVELTDVTATILGYAGVEVPDRMDSIPLPGTGIDGCRPRNSLLGFLNHGWMLYEERYKLAKYGKTGNSLYDMDDDPTEQHNLYGQPQVADIQARMERELTEHIMNGIKESHFDKRVYNSSLSQSPAFGREGWKRTYPQVIGKAP